ncbi:MAG: hypothetical protein O3A10_04740 [Chloroflexi bacterium]|nr:hypothetical protein [Chloroflexota bacterium]MDA1145554.1 hypothetical protein [Chloroflexota bacterium]
MGRTRSIALLAVGLLVVGAAAITALRMLRSSDRATEEWAVAVCSASASHPLDEAPWQALVDRFAEGLLLLDAHDPPDGAEAFHAIVHASREQQLVPLRAFARTDPDGSLRGMLDDLQRIADIRPRGPSTDAALGTFFATVGSADGRIREAAGSLPQRSREAIEDQPDCADRLLG